MMALARCRVIVAIGGAAGMRVKLGSDNCGESEDIPLGYGRGVQA